MAIAPVDPAHPLLVCDAHPILWYLFEDRRLSVRARAILDDVDSGRSILVIPAVALAICEPAASHAV